MIRFSRRFPLIKFLLLIGFIWFLLMAYFSYKSNDQSSIVNKAVELNNKLRQQALPEPIPLFNDFDDDFAEIRKKNSTRIRKTKIKVNVDQRDEIENIPPPPLPAKIIEFHNRLNLTNPGHMGAPVILPSDLPIDIQEIVNKSWEIYAINEFVSNLIPLYRELPDIRPDYCRTVRYSVELPVTSVIMVFHNEPFTMIMRSVFAVLKRTPANLLGEILLVDDCSDKRLYSFNDFKLIEFLNIHLCSHFSLIL